jgi:hypothetical protein
MDLCRIAYQCHIDLSAQVPGELTEPGRWAQIKGTHHPIALNPYV